MHVGSNPSGDTLTDRPGEGRVVNRSKVSVLKHTTLEVK
jgi:hypothetical protein